MATIDGGVRELPRSYWIAGLLGAYACVIAASPNPTAAAALSVPLLATPFVLWTLQTTGRWLWCFFFAALLLPPLPFALGNSGPHVAVALAGLGLLCGALRLPEWRLKRDLLPFSMAVFFLVLLCELGAGGVLFRAKCRGRKSGASSAVRNPLVRVLLFRVRAQRDEVRRRRTALDAVPVLVRRALGVVCLRRFLLPIPCARRATDLSSSGSTQESIAALKASFMKPARWEMYARSF